MKGLSPPEFQTIKAFGVAFNFNEITTSKTMPKCHGRVFALPFVSHLMESQKPQRSARTSPRPPFVCAVDDDKRYNNPPDNERVIPIPFHMLCAFLVA